jgi:hypothetical protein
MEKIKNSKELKERIRCLEIEKEEYANRLKSYFRPSADGNFSGNLLQSILSNTAAIPDLKSMAIKTFVGLATQFLINKIFSQKVASPPEERTDGIIDHAINQAINKNSTSLNEEEKIILKKMLHQYLVLNKG